MEITGVGTMFLDENLELRKFTPKISKIFQIVDADIGRPVSHLPHQLSDVDIDAVIDEVVGTNQHIEKEVQANDGSWYLLRAMPYAIGTESFSGSVITFIDINELKTSQSSFRMLAENIKDVFWMRTTHNHKVTYVSPAYEKIWGRDIQELYKDPSAFIEAIHPDDRDRFVEQMDRCADGQWEMDYRIQKPDSEVNWIHDRGFPVYGADGEVEMICGFASDITNRKIKEDLCQISVSRFNDTFQDVDVGIALIDLQGHTLQSNSTLQKMLNYTEDDLRGKRLSDLIPSEGIENKASCFDEMATGERDFFQTRNQFLIGNGQLMEANLAVTLIRDASGQPSYAICLLDNLESGSEDPH
jgi:two-component system CheB/CheR fusion protein